MAISWDMAAVEAALITHANAATGIPFRIYGVHASPPQYPYGTLQWLSGPVASDTPSYEHFYSASKDLVTYKIRTTANVTVRYQVYSQDFSSATTSARYYAESLVTSHLLLSTLDTLHAVGLVPLQRPGVIDVSETLGDEVMTRAAVDVRYRIMLEAVEDTEFIESVEVTQGRVTLPDGTSVDSAFTEP